MSFVENVIRHVKAIPRAQVAPYGLIASLSGSPRAARQVGRILASNSTSDHLPWWRVVNRDGFVTISNLRYPAQMQAQLLKDEGVKLIKKKGLFWVDLSHYGWQPR